MKDNTVTKDNTEMKDVVKYISNNKEKLSVILSAADVDIKELKDTQAREACLSSYLEKESLYCIVDSLIKIRGLNNVLKALVNVARDW